MLSRCCKRRKYRVWVLEELDDWIPDCLFEEGVPDVIAGEENGSNSSEFLNQKLDSHGNEKSQLHGEDVRLESDGVNTINFSGSQVPRSNYCSFSSSVDARGRRRKTV
ncbi:hypothetical protein Hanom_Chr04g00373741 [Helianthus anomalus]